MFAWLADFHFLRPWWLLGCPISILLVWLLYPRVASAYDWTRLIAPALFKHLVYEQTSARKPPLWLLALALSLIAFAMAGPTWQKKPVSGYFDQVPVVFLLDVSWSMNASDLTPTRLQHAKITLYEWFKRQNGKQHGLIVYAGFAHAVVPITFDSQTISHLLPSITPEIMPAFGSNLTAAIEQLLHVVTRTSADTINLVILTDGTTTADANKAATVLKQADGIHVNTVVIGYGKQTATVISTKDNRDILLDDGSSLQAGVEHDGSLLFARLVDGAFFPYQSVDQVIDGSDAFFAHRWHDKHRKTDITFDAWVDTGYWLLLLALPLALLLFRRGWFVCLLLLPLAQPSQAFDWNSLWQTDDQRALALYKARQYKEAGKLFTRDDWRASSAFHAEEYQAAQNLFADDQSPRGQYNLATTFAKQKNIDAALALYDQLLQREDIHPEIKRRATHNKRILERMQQQERQKQANNKPNNKPDDASSSEQQQNEQQENGQQEGAAHNQQTQPSNRYDGTPSKQQQAAATNDTQQETPSAHTDARSESPTDDQPSTSDAPADAEKERAQQQPSTDAQSGDALANNQKLTSMERQQLQSVDNDVGKLLARKFRLQYRNHQQDRRVSDPNDVL